MNICDAFWARCSARGKSYCATLLTTALLALPTARLAATPVDGSGTEANPWIFNSSNYPQYFSSVQYSVYLGYFFNDVGAYYETTSSVDVSGQTYPSIYVGYSNIVGKLTIDNAYTVTDVTGYIGYGSGGGGTVVVTGSGSKWANTGDLYLGYDGNGEIDVQSGGSVSSAYLYLGYQNAGSGTLNIESGSVSASQNCSIGHSSTGSGAVTVNGSSASLTVTKQLLIGDKSTGSLTIENGGAVTSNIAVLGNNSGVTGTALVTGSGSSWTGTDGITVGYTGNGILNIEEKGEVTTAGLFIGYYEGATGTVTVTGEDSKLTDNNILCVGYEGTGTLNIEDGGSGSNASAYLGGYTASDSTGSGTVNVKGSGSTWASGSEVYAGYYGKGAINVESGGKVTVGDCLYLGENSGSSGTVTVSGKDMSGNASTLTATGYLMVGYNGTGALTIGGGGHVSNTDCYIGANSGSSGTALVTGSGSLWANSGELLVGHDGTGTLTIEEGALVTANSFAIGTGSKLYIGGGYLAVSGDATTSLNALLDGGTKVYAWDGTSYTLITSSSSSLVSLTYYANVASCASLTSYSLGGAYTVLTSAYSVPEASTWALIGGMSALSLALCARRRRRV
jgi:fibronectin-binding autotransporter adhesin